MKAKDCFRPDTYQDGKVFRCRNCDWNSGRKPRQTGDCERDCQHACAYPGQFGCDVP